ncbi:FAD-dependent oxidoreductase [Verminephrobacter eiseniae]|uniref:FAD-dependent oxidoreductase n=1 Tax=Verminephrobacter eiseniae TaxID=364317 RepID=UPI0022372597|nr:FAD-dependent oxidoreductase [Verminephrobacter eiseniae]MCW5296361.1 FAD-dependent oxidoreductase [Verminephrobacter eiseniae]MCW8187886.1 FAD-dependent oxidoreductase [Verminephrobacter eiseniae]MCW8226148.1 FAD-dependent oxidoreductase [Verminephrobacter eiseniae]MCW8232946.1 FAD-dependent oxidoreductase [Verminephrobacter eiseniae]
MAERAKPAAAAAGAQAPAFDLIIVGAGPAGLSAALTAARHGLAVVVVDEQHDAGGQIFRQPPPTFCSPPSSAFDSYAFGAPLLEHARRCRAIQWRLGTTAWGVFTPPCQGRVQVAIAGAGDSELLEARALLIATGAYDLPVAFAGWTLPGVMSAGGMQTLLKSQFLRAGKRFVLAGSHPLLLLVADALVQAGGEILELAIARTRPALQELLAGWRAVPGHWRLLAQSAKALRNLRRHRVPIRFGTLVLRADGDPAVEQVTLGSVDSAWQVQPGTERVLQADTLVIGYGLLAASELARQAGCAVHWRPAAGGWVVRHDAQMRTSVERVCVAGEPAGVGGAEVAFLQGQLAALGIAATLHGQEPSPTLARAMRQTARALGKARRWSDLVLRLFEPRLDALARLASDDTLVCRCEEVTAGSIREFLADNPHVSDVNSVKLGCRSGMGYCQGRYCQHSVAQLLAQARQTGIEHLGVFTAQAPIKPVPAGALARLKA